MIKLKKAGKLQQTITLSLPLLCAIQSASALGLGDINVNSSLNQPLSVSAPLLLSPNEKISAEEIIAGLANAAEHNRAGLPYANILRDLKFNITRAPGGQMVLNINSQRSMYEPIVNFLVDLNWKNGHLVKEVSIFLDPPNYQAARPAPEPVAVRPSPIAVETKAAVSKTRATATSERQEPSKPRRTVKKKPVVIEDGNYTVQRGDSLSRIALATSRQSGLTMKEAMQLIYDLNPEAFMGSMDRLKAGADLLIPDMSASTETVATQQPDTTAPPVKQQVLPEQAAKPEPKPEIISPPEVVTPSTEGARLEIVPPEITTEPAETTAVTTEIQQPGVTEATIETPDQAAIESLIDEQVEFQTQLKEIQGENNQLQTALNDTKEELAATHAALADLREEMKSLVELQPNQTSTVATTTTKTWSDMIPWILTALAFGLLALFGFRKNKAAPAPLAETPYSSTVSPREIANMAETQVDHPDTRIDQVQPVAKSLLDEFEESVEDNTLLTEDDSTQIVPPTSIIDNDLTPDEPASELDSVQETEIYLAYHQYSLAEKSINRLQAEDPENHIYKLLKLRLLAETGKMDEMQSLSIDLFRQFPDRDDETHQKIQSICDKAFTSTTDVDSTAATSLTALTGETEIIDSIDDSDPTSETFIQDDMTDFLADAVEEDTTPELSLEDQPFNRDQLEADTIAVEEQDLTLPEYKQASDDINFIAEDLTEEGLDLPFDLETEILEEEARRMASDRKEKKGED